MTLRLAYPKPGIGCPKGFDCCELHLPITSWPNCCDETPNALHAVKKSVQGVELEMLSPWPGEDRSATPVPLPGELCPRRRPAAGRTGSCSP